MNDKNSYMKEYYQKNKDVKREIQRKYYHSNKEIEKLRSLKKYSDPKQRMNQIFSRVRRKAIAENREFNLFKDYLFMLMIVQDYKCAVTKIPFDYSSPGENTRNPFGPSIDRINSKLDYTIGNVQFVCWIVNAAKNEYSQEIFDKMCLARAELLNGKT